MPDRQLIAENLARVRDEIEWRAREANRPSSNITLCAVSKTFPADTIRQAIAAGQFVFGENRVQEAEQKWPKLKAECDDIELHLIGPLQTNKVRRAVSLFDVIQTVDRERLARALAKEMANADRPLPCYVQVNTGEEPQKAGIPPGETEAFVDLCRNDLGLDVVGLMCIPPHEEESSLHFALLQDMAARFGLSRLSMGMSADYAVTVQFGATVVRGGSAIFGARTQITAAAD